MGGSHRNRWGLERPTRNRVRPDTQLRDLPSYRHHRSHAYRVILEIFALQVEDRDELAPRDWWLRIVVPACGSASHLNTLAVRHNDVLMVADWARDESIQ